MRWLLSSLFLLAACTTAATQRPPEDPLNPIARDYVRLALEMDTHERGYVDAYYGPPELKTEAEAHPRSVADLKTEADRIIAAVERVRPEALPQLERMRRERLLVYGRSSRFRLDMMEGTRAPFAEEAWRLFNLRPVLKPLSDYDPVLARIETIAPGEGPLWRRVEAMRAHYLIPADRLSTVVGAGIAECRRRTLLHIALPANENFSMELVNHQSWGAYNWYHGNAQSVIQINTDFPIAIDRVLGLGCHEGYPGHHVQGIYAEKLYKERGWIEFSIAPLFSPQGPLDEGGANFGVDLAFPGPQRLAYETTTLYPLAGLNPDTAPAFDALRRAINDLAGARITIAQMYLDGQVGREEALDLIQKYQLVSREKAAQSLAFTEHYRSYVINYATGEDLVRAYVTRAGGMDAQWLAYTRVIAEPTLPQDLH
jgi:hypothetical protein